MTEPLEYEKTILEMNKQIVELEAENKTLKQQNEKLTRGISEAVIDGSPETFYRQKSEIASLKQQLSAEKQIHETTEQYWVDKYNSLVSKIKQHYKDNKKWLTMNELDDIHDGFSTCAEGFEEMFAEELNTDTSVERKPSGDSSIAHKKREGK